MKMSNIQKKIHKKARLFDKHKRIKNKKRKYMLYYIFFISIFFTITTILSLTVFFKIKKINLKISNLKITQEEFLNKINLKIDDSLILVDIKKITQQLVNNFINLSNLEIEKKFPDQINIKCSFDEIIFILETQNGQFFGVSPAGRLIKTYVDEPNPELEHVMIIKLNLNNNNNNQTPKIGDFIEIDENSRKFLTKIVDELLITNFKKINKIDLKNDFEATITYDNRIKIQIHKFSKIKTLLQTSLEIIKNYVGNSETGIITTHVNNRTIHFIPTTVDS